MGRTYEAPALKIAATAYVFLYLPEDFTLGYDALPD
jgi:hypothetical protein